MKRVPYMPLGTFGKFGRPVMLDAAELMRELVTVEILCDQWGRYETDNPFDRIMAWPDERKTPDAG